jgi:broad specificity phosphatase PhoE
LKPTFVIFFFLVILYNSSNCQISSVKELKQEYKIQESDTCLFLKTVFGTDIEQIILIRHGEPDLMKKGWRNRKEADQYILDYDSAEIIVSNFKPVCGVNPQTARVFHSSLPRARHTAKVIFPDYFDMIEDKRFVEFQRKTMKFFNVKLPLKFWTVSSRLLWLMGLNDKGIENKKEAKKRARLNAEFLEKSIDERNVSVLVGHGLHNRYIKKYLKKSGWKSVYDSGSGYLSMKILAREEF